MEKQFPVTFLFFMVDGGVPPHGWAELPSNAIYFSENCWFDVTNYHWNFSMSSL